MRNAPQKCCNSAAALSGGRDEIHSTKSSSKLDEVLSQDDCPGVLQALLIPPALSGFSHSGPLKVPNLFFGVFVGSLVCDFGTVWGSKTVFLFFETVFCEVLNSIVVGFGVLFQGSWGYCSSKLRPETC